MSADLQKIRNSKLFKKLPDRAFERVSAMMKVRAFEAAEEALHFAKSTEFSKYYGYVVSGEILFLGADGKPLGIAIQDEFFLGRPFSMNEVAVERLISANPRTLVVFVPREIITVLAEVAEQYADMFEEIYESIFERSKVVASDPKGLKAVQDFLKDPSVSSGLEAWIQMIEKKRADSRAKKMKERKFQRRLAWIWSLGLIICIFFTIECLARLFKTDFSFIYFWDPNWKIEAYKPGSDFNIMIGIIGYALLILTNLHSFFKWAIRKLKWKINYQFSQQLHIFFGVLGFLFILLHTSFHLTGINVAYLATYALFIVMISGLVGQFISSQIPKTIRGETVRLENLKEEQEKLKGKAQLLMEDEKMYKTSILMLSKERPRSAWENIFLAPLAWFRASKLKNSLESLGLSKENADLAAKYVMQEFHIAQKIRFLEISNAFFKRWMMIHKPFGYILYALGAIHIVLAMGWI